MADPILPPSAFAQALGAIGNPELETLSEIKRASVEEAAEAKRLLMGGRATNQAMAVAVEEGNRLGQNPVVQDLVTGRIGELSLRYGPDVALAAGGAQQAAREYDATQGSRRDNEQVVGDALRGIGAGTVGGLGGLAGLAAGVVSDDAGAAVAGATNRATEALRDGQSPSLQDRRELFGVRRGLDQQDIDETYREEREAGNAFAGLRRFGREVMETAKDLASNPALAGDVTAEGLGSLVASGGIARVGASGAAKLLLRQRGITGEAATRFLRTAEGRELVTRLATQGMPASIGLQEAGGVYAGIQAEIQAMSEAELSDTSPEYMELRAGGMSHEDARDRIANIAGLEGGAIQGLVGAATGTLVSRFEASPFGGASRSLTESLRTAGSNALREGTEEAIQSGSGAFNTNLAIQRYADEGRDLASGLGVDATMGAVGGTGMAGVLAVPEVAAVGGLTVGDIAARNAYSELSSIGRGIQGVVNDRVASVEAAREASSPTGTQAVQEAAVQAENSLGTIATELATQEAAQETTEAPVAGTQEAQGQSLAARVQETLAMSPEEVSGLPTAVRNRLPAEGGVARITGVLEVLRDIVEGNPTPEERAAETLWVREQVERLKQTTADLDQLPENLRDAGEQSKSLLETILTDPRVKEVVEAAETLQQTTDLRVTEENVETPEVQDEIRKTVLLARANPAGVDPEFVEGLLNQRRRVNLPENVQKDLEAAAALAREMNEADGRKQKAAAEEPKATRKTTDIVRKEVLQEGKNNELGQYGLSRHLSNIVTALGQGNTGQAQLWLDNLRNFGEHYQNKIRAAEQSAALKRANRNKISYRTWTGSGWLEATDERAGAIGINPNSPNSRLLGREAVIDADTVADIYNNLLTIYQGQLSGTPLEKLPAPAAFSEPAEAASTAVTTTTQDPTPTITETPTETQEVTPQATTTEQDPVEESSQEDADLVVIETDDQGEEEVSDAAAVQTPVSQGQEDPQGDAEEQSAEATAEAEAEESSEEPAGEPDAEGGEGGDTDGGSTRARPDFGHLPKTAKGVNRFERAYDIDPDRSLLMQNERPMRGLLAMLQNFEGVKDQLKLPYRVDESHLKAWQDMLMGPGAAIIKRMNARLREKQKTIRGGKLSVLEALAQGIDITDWKETRVANLVNLELGEYDPRLLQSAVLAGMHWVMTAPSTQNLDAEEVAEFFEVPVEHVTATMIKAVNSGLGANAAAENLARQIMEFWGATPKPGAPLSDINGIVQSLAAEMVLAMRDVLITERTFLIEKVGKEPKPTYNFKLAHKNSEALIDGLRGTRKMLKDIFVPGAEKPYYFDRLPETVRAKQKANPIGDLGSRMRRALKAHQEIKIKRNTPFVGMMRAFGEDFFLNLLGYQPVEAERMNKVDMLSVEGKNLQLKRSWELTLAHSDEQDLHAKEQGKDPEEVETHFDWYTVSNERIHAEGFNPQSDKVMREAMIATRATLDLSNPVHDDAFWVTVAQSTGLVKTEIVSRKTAVAKVQKDLEAYSETLEILQSWIEGGMQGELSAEQKATIQDELDGVPVTAKFLHSLLAVARYSLAIAEGRESPAAKTFQHDLSLEADGKTDGPINAIVHFTRDYFTDDELANLAKGGFFIGEEGKTLNAHNEVDGDDLYKTTANKTTSFIGAMAAQVKDTAAEPHMASLLRILSAIGEIEYDDKAGTLVIGRGVLKNPLTITVYGSGAAGIAGKVARGIMEALYERMSEVQARRKELGDESLDLQDAKDFQTYERLFEDIARLTTTRTFWMPPTPQREGKWVVSKSVGKNKMKAPLGNLSDLKNFEFSLPNQMMLAENVLTLFVKPMRAAIGQTLGSVLDTTQLFQTATQIQSALLVDVFQNTVTETIKDHRKTGKLEPGEYLTQEVYQEIFKKLAPYGAVVESPQSDEHHLNLSSKESGKADVEFFRSLDGRFSGKATLPMPSSAGVKVTPLLTISRGDAQMMVNYFVSQNPDLRVLPVFDGLEMPADALDTIGEAINKAVAEGWFENPAKDVSDRYQDFLSQGVVSLKNVTSWQTYQQIYKSLKLNGPFNLVMEEIVQDLPYPPEDAKKSELDAWNAAVSKRVIAELQEDTEKMMKEIGEELQDTARSIQARKNVLKRITFSVDHMASAEAPYTQKGLDIEGDPVEFLNKLYNEEMIALVAGEEQPTGEVTAKPDAAFQKLIDDFGVKTTTKRIKSEVTRMTNRSASRMIEASSLDPDAKAMARSIAKMLDGYTFYFGTSRALTAHRNKINPEHKKAGPIDLGQTDVLNKRIFVVNATPETLVHEMLHGATRQILLEHYSGTPGDETRQTAIKNLEILLGQFVQMDFAGEPAEVARAAEILREEIEGALSRETPSGKADAMSEFISWALTNHNLASKLQKTRVRSKLAGFASTVIQAIRKLFGLPAGKKMDVFSNLRFNTAALIQSKALEESQVTDPGLLNQVSGRARDTRLDRLTDTFQAKIKAHLDARPVLKRLTEELRINDLADQAANMAVAHGFNLDPQQLSAFRSMQAALASLAEFDNNSLVQVQKIFTHAVKELSVESFMVDPDLNDPNDRAEAQEKFNFITGKYGTLEDQEGRSNLVTTFVALSQVDPEFARILKSIEMPKSQKLSFKSVDAALDSLGTKMMDTLSRAITKGGVQDKKVGQALDTLALVLGKIEQDDRSFIEKKTQSILGAGDEKLAGWINQASDGMTSYGNKLLQDQTSTGAVKKVKDALGHSLNIMANLMDAQKGQAMGAALTSFGNQAPAAVTPLMELMNEVLGITDENRAVYELINKVKYAVSSVRQEFREVLPEFFASQFSRKLSAHEWGALHTALGKTDIGAMTGRSATQVRKFFTDAAARAAEISKLEGMISAAGSRGAPAALTSAKDLAEFMVTGKIDPNNHALKRNATAIATLVLQDVRPAMVKALDELTTLYAIDKLDAGTMATMAQLLAGEAKGVDFLTFYIADARKKEQAKVVGSFAKLNGWKGYIPSERRDGTSLIVASDSENKKLRSLGYTRIGDYQGAGLSSEKRGYYYSTVAGNNAYMQGVMQTVQQSFSGIDPITGKTVSGISAGIIKGPIVAVYKQRLDDRAARGYKRRSGEALMPVYHDDGSVAAYELSMAPDALQRLQRNDHLGEMLGAWSGRQVEEELAQGFNSMLVDRLHKHWTQAKREQRRGEYVDLSSSRDPIHQDAWKMVPVATRRMIEDVFGDEGFMVRKDMLNNSVGTREASVADMWTGVSRVPEKVRKTFEKTATALFGQNAFQILVTAEKAWQSGVSVAKNTIVIRSVIVPMSNAMSNFVQLLSSGVGLRDIYKGFTTKLVEIDQFLKHDARRVELQALLARHRNNPIEARKLETELKSLNDADKRMSIWPLIEAGEFSTISEGLTDADAAISQGKWADKIKELVDKVPAQLGTVGRYAVVARDTALFQGMSRAVQYGDFLGKAVLYDHLTKREGQSHDTAMKRVTEAFVNYNLLPGRVRSYTESMGLAWFWAYKLRSIKEAHRMILNNPLRALLTSQISPAIPTVAGADVGSPLTDNALSVIWDGRAGYSIGPGMLFQAPGLNPWVNLMN